MHSLKMHYESQTEITDNKLSEIDKNMKQEQDAEGMYPCDICIKKFDELKKLKIHKFKKHLEPRKITDNNASNDVSQNPILNTIHKTINKDSEGNVFCDICNKKFNKVGKLKLHKIYKHEQIANGTFSCKICNKQFDQERKLNIHNFKKHIEKRDDNTKKEPITPVIKEEQGEEGE